MRNAFADEITKLAEKDKRIVLMPADIGNKLFDNFKGRFPDRFYNCGVAEANLISMAAGLATNGLRPIGYTITPFITTRCYEQIRVDMCYNNLPVIIVAVGAGLSYAPLGATHHSCEDMAIMRVLPNMTVLCPSDPYEVRAVIREALKHDGPVYIRLGKKNDPVIHDDVPDIRIGKGMVIEKGDDICLLSIGNMLSSVLMIAKLLSENGISAEVVNMITLKPLDTGLLSDIFKRFKFVATIEEHSLIGGLGSSVAEWLADNNCSSRLLRFGTSDVFLHKVGEQSYLREVMGLAPEKISEKIIKEIKNGN